MSDDDSSSDDTLGSSRPIQSKIIPQYVHCSYCYEQHVPNIYHSLDNITMFLFYCDALCMRRANCSYLPSNNINIVLLKNNFPTCLYKSHSIDILRS